MLSSENINYLVVHCSDTDNDDNIGAKEIHELHLSFGWDGIGYHKIIQRSGLIEVGRPEFWIGAHVFQHNLESLGVCLIGKDKFTKNQFNSLKIILKDWKVKYPKAKIVGHCYFDNTNKTCPNFNLKKWLIKVNLN